MSRHFSPLRCWNLEYKGTYLYIYITIELMSTPLPIRVDPSAPVPLAAQLAQQLSWLIVSGVLKEGEELPAAQEMADELDVNFHTVRAAYKSLATDGLISVSRGRRARILRFDRTKTASSQADSPSFSIGVIIPAFVPFYGQMLRGIEAAAALKSTMVMVANAHEDPDTALEYLDRFIAKAVDGVIVAAALIPPEAPLPPPGRPSLVFIDSPGAPGPSIEFDLQKSQRLATGHLIEHGHERIGYITPPIEIPNVTKKWDGHVEALDTGGIPTDEELVVITQDFETESGRKAADQLLSLSEPPSAIAAASDSLALGAYHAIRSRQLEIPDDVALVGNDGSELGAIIRPALTTVTVPAQEAGRRAFETLGAVVTADEPRRTVLDVELTIRDSCGRHI